VTHFTEVILIFTSAMTISLLCAVLLSIMKVQQSRAMRCKWCGVKLRWWQLYWCRTCAFYMRWNHPSPPCMADSRRYAEPDRFLGEKSSGH
jgi:hypothetical protein